MPPAALHQLDSYPARKDGLVTTVIDGETAVYDRVTDKLHLLDRSATAVWQRLDGSRALGEIADDIAAAYGVAEHVALRDVTTLAAALGDQGLLSGSAAAPGSPPQPVAMPASGGGPTAPLPAPRHVIGPYRGLEHSFDIATSDGGVASYLDRILADLRDGGRGEVARYDLVGAGSQYVVRHDQETVVMTGRLDRALAVLLWHINSEVVRRSTPCYPVVHAAAAVKGGVTVLLPAAPSSGKTTTVAGLISRAGFGYVSDEAVGIDPATLLTKHYPKPLSIDRGSWPALPELRPEHDLVTGQWQVPARSIVPRPATAQAPIRFVIEPAYDPAARTRLVPVTRGTMLMRLADSAFNFASAPERNLAVLARVAEGAECYRLPVSDLDQAIALIDDLMTPLWRSEPSAAGNRDGSNGSVRAATAGD
jgi:hypothetical protein